MREQLIQYVQLLFAGAADCDDTRQEILQNTLDRYDDLIAAGKTPEAAYRLAIMGIGDINEILGRAPGAAPLPVPAVKQEEHDTPAKKLLRAIAHWAVHPLPHPAVRSERHVEHGNSGSVRDADPRGRRHGAHHSGR